MKRKIILLIILIGIFILIIIAYFSCIIHADGYVTSTISISVSDKENRPIENATILFFKYYDEQRWDELKKTTHSATELLKNIKMVKTDSLGKALLKGEFDAAFYFPIPHTVIWGWRVIRIEKTGYQPVIFEIDAKKNTKKILKNKLSFQIQMKKDSEEESL